MPLALARKYRPRSFAAVAVQSHVSTTLLGAIAHDRVAHGYLLCGPRGTGKTTLARVLAMALNCERRGERSDGEPCGECGSCRRIWSGAASLDVVEIDAASNRGVDDARELRERAMYAPSAGDRYKVYIVDEAHMLTREAWNALLKILEEPPPRVVFVFATTDPQKIAQSAAPVLSRLQRFDLKRIGAADIRQRLRDVLTAEGIAADEEALAMLARAADGSMRDALSLTDQVLALGDTAAVTPDRVRDALGLVPEDEYLAALAMLAQRRAGDVFPYVARIADAGIDFSAFFTGLADLLRAQLAAVLGTSLPDVGERTRAAVMAHREVWSAGDLLRMLGAITELEPHFRKSAQQQLLLETLLVRCALLDRAVMLEELLRGLEPGSDAALRSSRAAGARTGGEAVSSGRAGAGRSPGATPPEAPPPAASARSAGPPSARTPAGAPVTGGGPAGSLASMDAGPVGFGLAAPPTRYPPPQPAGQPSRVAPPRDAPRAWDTDDEGQVAVAVSAPPAPDVERLVARWPDVVDRVRRERQAPMLIAALEQSRPEVGLDAEVVTLRLTEPNDILARAIEHGRDDVLAALRAEWPQIERVRVATPEDVSGAPPRRVTAEAVRAERVGALRRRDPVLGAAIDALDLELIE